MKLLCGSAANDPQTGVQQFMGFEGVYGIFPGAVFAILDMQSLMAAFSAEFATVMFMVFCVPAVGNIANAGATPLRNTPSVRTKIPICRARLRSMARS